VLPAHPSRRHFLIMAGGALTLTACRRAGDGVNAQHGAGSAAPSPVLGDDRAVADAERRRTAGGAKVVTAVLTAAPFTADLAGREVRTWGYGGAIPGAVVRATAGQLLDVTLRNHLPVPTSIHWHGLALRNDMDGVNNVTQNPIRPGLDFTYRFALAHPGTYWFHPHVGTQLDRALYAPLIVDDPDEPGRYDAEHVLVLDDWLDGFGTTPDEVLDGLRVAMPGSMAGMEGMEGMDHSGGAMAAPAPAPTTTAAPAPPPAAVDLAPQGTGIGATGPAMGQFSSSALGGDAGDVAYALHLVNGRPPQDRATFGAPPRGRVRLRIINAASDTAYRFAVGGHRLTVTHTDGFPVAPVDVDALIIGMGERYDVTVTARPGAWPVVALAEGKRAAAVAVLRTDDVQSAPPPVNALPAEFKGRLLEYGALRAADAVRLPGRPTTAIDVAIAGDMASYRWAIRGPDGNGPIRIEQGQRVRLNLVNTTTMWHPIHLHGHTFGLADGPDGAGGARKDTVNVLPGQTVPIQFSADNPGQWMLHCHNTYHFESGMMTTVSYVR
jgi:FtsP/CotA-like multicopper oxidase with cupredoxin domain